MLVFGFGAGDVLVGLIDEIRMTCCLPLQLHPAILHNSKIENIKFPYFFDCF